MEVKFQASASETAVTTCEAVFEGEQGIHLMSETSEEPAYQIGYVPYENLFYARPESDG